MRPPAQRRGNRAEVFDGASLEADQCRFRTPALEDGPAIWSLARESGTLELNSPYAYLLSATYFAETSVIAEREGRLAGFVWAFPSPPEPDTVFVWQIGVAAEFRGEGLGKELLKRLLARCRDIRFLEATVTPSNHASAALFRSFARDLEAPCAVTPAFPSDVFPDGAHEPEELFRIGPIDQAEEETNVGIGDEA